MSLDNQQNILANQSYIVMAGAGAGKTTRLVKHIVENFLSFKSKYKRWPRIIGTTFTKKAAREIQDRVSVLYKDYDDSDIFEFAYSDSLNIGTIHGICYEFLSRKSYLLGFDQQIKIVNQDHIAPIKKKLIFNIISESFPDLLIKFKFNQVVAILNFFDERKEIEFKPVDDKTQESLLLKYIEDYKSKFSKLYSQINADDLPKTDSAKKAMSYLAQLINIFDLSYQSQSLEELYKYFKMVKQDKPRFKVSIEKTNVWEDIWSLRNELKKDLSERYLSNFDKSKFELLSDIGHQFALIYKEYSNKLFEYKKEKSIIEISDIEILTLKLLKKHRSACEDLIKQWDYYYIDEYQDTNLVQKEIFAELLTYSQSFKVGDPQQSIYLFRGAKSSIFENEFAEALSSEHILSEKLAINYRSSKNLLLGINELFDSLGRGKFNPMEPFHETDEEEKRIHLYLTEDEDLEIEETIKLILQKVASGVSYSDICILSRTKSLLTKYELRLQAEGIPTVLSVSGNFKHRPEVVEAMNLVKFLNKPDEDSYITALLNSPLFGLSKDRIVDIFLAYKKSKSWSLWSFLLENEFKDLEVVLSLKEISNTCAEIGIIDALKNFYIDSNLLSFAKDKNDLNRRHSNLLKLLSEITQNVLDDLDLEAGVIQMTNAKSKNQLSESVFSGSSYGIKLMTIHGSKGLEFDEVFVVGASRKGKLSYSSIVEFNLEGQFVVPYSDFANNIRVGGPLQIISKNERVLGEKEETLRQIYVAATRAKKHLYFIGAKKAQENSIYKSINVDINSKFNFINVVEIEGAIEKPLGFSRNWDFGRFKNEVCEFKSSYHNYMNEDIAFKSENIIKNISVTALVDLISDQNFVIDYKVQAEVFFERYDSKSDDKVLLGVLYHKYLELYAKGLSQESLKFRFSGSYLGDLSGIWNSIQSLLLITNPPLAEVLANCKVEWGFNSVLDSDILVSGKIDMWGFDNKGDIHIFDYKTGSSRYMNKSSIQLAIYKSVLSKLFPNVKINTYIVYLIEGRLVTLDIDSDRLMKSKILEITNSDKRTI